jgi:hypothetical protein
VAEQSSLLFLFWFSHRLVILSGCDFIEVIKFETKLSSRPKRSEVEGPAVPSIH